MYRGPSRIAFAPISRLRQSSARAMRFARSRTNTMTQRRRSSVSGIGVTTQRDSKFVYAKRRMPRRRRRQWKRFRGRVNAVAEKELGSRTVVRNHSTSFGNDVGGKQSIMAFYLYPQRGTGLLADDLNQIAGLENVGDQTLGAGETIDESTKFLFQSAVLDITMCNRSTHFTAPSTYTQRPEAKLEVDVYECSVSIPTEETGAVHANFMSLLFDNAARTRSIGGAGLEVDIDTRGATPWDLTYALSRWRIKIWKKTKYMIPNGDVVTYQVRDPRRRVATRRDLIQKDGFNRPGWTRIIFIVAKLVPGLTVGAVDGTYQETMYVGVTRKYLYKIEGINEDRTRFV